MKKLILIIALGIFLLNFVSGASSVNQFIGHLYENVTDNTFNATKWLNTSSTSFSGGDDSLTFTETSGSLYGEVSTTALGSGTLNFNASLLPSINTQLKGLKFNLSLQTAITGAGSASASLRIFGTQIFSISGNSLDFAIWSVVANESNSSRFDVYRGSVFNRTVIPTDNTVNINVTGAGSGGGMTGVATARFFSYDYYDTRGITLTSPTNNSFNVNALTYFNATTSGIFNMSLINATVTVYNATGFYGTNTTNLSGYPHQNFTTTLNLPIGAYTYTYNLWASNGTANYTFETGYNYSFVNGFSIDALNYTTPIYESQTNVFTLNLSYSQSRISDISAVLVYNGTTYTPTETLSTDSADYYVSLSVPEVTTATNYNFYWVITVVSSEGTYVYNTSTYTQVVNPISPLVFSSTCTDRAYMFTLKDEENFTTLNGTINYNFRFGINNGTYSQVYGQLNSTTFFYLCINSTLSPTWTIGEGELQYSVNGYVDRRYYIFDNTIVTNNTNNVSLYELLSTEQTSFSLETEDRSLTPYVDKYTALLRWYPNLNQYLVVEMGRTNAEGDTVIHVETEDVDYRVALYYRNGTLIQLDDPTRFVCLVNPCTYTLRVDPSDTDFTSYLKVAYDLNYNETTQIFTLTFSDSTQRTDSMALTVYKDTGAGSTTVCSTSTAGFVGVLTCDISAYTSGTFRAVVTRTASPPSVIAQRIINIVNSALKSSFGLWLSMLIAVPIVFFMAFISPIGAVIGIIIALIPAFWFGSINMAIFSGIIVLGIIIMHFMKRIG